MSAVGDELAGHVPETYLDFVPTQASILYGSSGKQVSFCPSARLGGVFLIAKESLEGGHDEDVLTCYRRNLFSIADTARDPSGHEPKITGLFARLKAVESRDSTEVTITSGANRANSTTERGARPADIPLIPPSRDGDPSAMSSEHLEIRFSWERLQFRSATANNGKRSKEIRQQFKVIVSIMTSKEDGSSSLITELGSSFLTVRGRSPKSFAVSEASQISALDAYWPENDVTGLDMHLPASSGRVWTSAPEVSFLDPYSSYMISDPSQDFIYTPNMWDWMNPSESVLETLTSIMDTQRPMDQEADVVSAGYQSQRGVADNPARRQSSGQHNLLSTSAPSRQGAIAEFNSDAMPWASAIRHSPRSVPTENGFLAPDTAPIPAFTPSHSALAGHTSSSRLRATSIVSTEGQGSNASKKQRTLSNSTPGASGEIRSRYSYLPIGISGWQPPVEPVYWSHPWSHIETDVGENLYRIKP
ncbi:hypothetical protein NW761_014634 [Fusarium oxysporum]|uniref:NDT80 domain-containing protein n=1 Tax=Fusarium oxysporum f. sp. pisi HDV247 TaxID=1080344 RepID=W9P3P5_FUSOX|nr:hypothetical protein FOVG_14028 [Fusarium oxysporum f. sp. pisi HDV247]KAJ4035482.1 hypothetical protein NW758_010516 [Fusarium oxysporum]KAJ4072745.1 hypothetical protein NW761_014634 [Fusarium oxysporum]